MVHFDLDVTTILIVPICVLLALQVTANLCNCKNNNSNYQYNENNIDHSAGASFLKNVFEDDIHNRIQYQLLYRFL